jgi:hypothetical protein
MSTLRVIDGLPSPDFYLDAMSVTDFSAPPRHPPQAPFLRLVYTLQVVSARRVSSAQQVPDVIDAAA